MKVTLVIGQGGKIVGTANHVQSSNPARVTVALSLGQGNPFM
jgi:hypothetical protein